MRAAEMKTALKHESGFSLIELMIAMVVTLIVTGAIYGLLAGGNSAFRREPELADRQQNARVAMAMIANDITNAGMGLPPFVQVFAAGLDGIGPNGEDGLEIIVGLPQCPAAPVCARGADVGGVAGNVAVIDTPIALSACFGLPEPAGPVAAGTPPTRLGAALFPAIGSPSFALIGPVTNDGGTNCGAAVTATGTRVSVQTDSGPAWWRTLQAAVAPVGPPQSVVPLEVIRYAIAPDPSDAPPSATSGAAPPGGGARRPTTATTPFPTLRPRAETGSSWPGASMTCRYSTSTAISVVPRTSPES